ncbi:hypothetical protein Ddc_15494 [Ditylenchus destructor]|nr:hypothetical protein Ddc_15494 [Ditylenchus destructor]
MTRTDKSSNLWLRKRTTCNISKPNYLKVCQKDKVACKDFVAIDMNNSNGSKKSSGVMKRLQKMELLARKLKVQLVMCTFVVIFTIAAYFLLWYSSECWALPFQESPCKKPRALPSIPTNHSTLAEVVDEFTTTLRPLIIKFNDTIEMPQLEERQSLSNATKNEIGQLFSQYSSNLVAFGALKREDVRLQDVERAIDIGSANIIICLLLHLVFMMILNQAIAYCKHPKTVNNLLAVEGAQNLQNARLQQLKRCVPLLYIATFISIAAEVILLIIFMYAQFYGGNSPVFVNECKYNESGDIAQKGCPFTNYLSSATKLKTNLNERFTKFDTSMESPNLDVRRLTFEWQSEAIATAIDHHLDLKQYDVDRRTMPRKIGNKNKKLIETDDSLDIHLSLPDDGSWRSNKHNNILKVTKDKDQVYRFEINANRGKEY